MVNPIFGLRNENGIVVVEVVAYPGPVGPLEM
jgi:hypothetical protein